MKLIEIVITPDGHTHLETKGYAGGECREASRQMEQALGIVKSDQSTAEMYAQAPETLRNLTAGGGP